MEGPLDAIKRVGKNLTTKVTADKLMSAWKKAGSPTDSAAVADVLRNAGVSDEVLAPAFKAMKIKLPKPGAAPAAKDAAKEPEKSAEAPAAKTDKPAAPAKLDYKAMQAAVAQLRTRDAQSLLKHIDSIDGAPAAQPATQQAAPAAPAAQTKVKVKGARAKTAVPAARPATPPVSV